MRTASSILLDAVSPSRHDAGMKRVIAGGSGQVGQILARAWVAEGHDVVILGRSTTAHVGRAVVWDGRTLGPWAAELDGAEVALNLAGRVVNCRYTPENLEEMLDSRVDATGVFGQAIALAARPPPLWLQMSTATIYAHRFDAPNDEATGLIGGHEPDAPASWRNSVEIARAWEQALAAASTPATRKVALRTTMVMSPDRGGIFDVMLGLVRRGLGGAAAGGAQYVSWIHDRDLVRAIRFLIEHGEIRGPVNLAAPEPLPQRDFNRIVRRAWGAPVGLPATRWMLALGAWAMGTETELVLKSRRVIPGVLHQAGFEFDFATWNAAAGDLVTRWRAG